MSMNSPERIAENVASDGFRNCVRVVASCVLATQLAFIPATFAASGSAETGAAAKIAAADKPVGGKGAPVTDFVLNAMHAELTRANTDLGKLDQPPYYLSYSVYDQDFTVLVGAYGSLLQDFAAHRRQADVAMRVGSPALDNTHGQSRPSGVTSGSLPLGNDQDALQRVLWELTDREYKRAVPSLLNVRTTTAVRAGEEDKSPDFSKEKPQTHLEDVAAAPL